MMENEDLTSGFVGEEAFAGVGNAFSDLCEIYSSPSGSNRLFRCERYGRLHVLKGLKPSCMGNAFYEQALRKEFNIGYQLEHPNICRTLGWEHLPELGHCILLEYIDGLTLKAFIEQGKLTRPLAYKLIAELCDALSYLHSKQVVHRDLKPANLLVTYNGNNLKLIDFSLSDCDDYDVLKCPAGTRYYLAPEMLQPGAKADFRVDIYSLGVIMGEMATLLKDKRLASISRRCTQRRPERRYGSAAEVALALGRKPIPAYRYAAMLAVGLAVAVGVGYGVIGRQEKHLPNYEAFPVFGNFSGSDACRRVLAEERIRLFQLEHDTINGQHAERTEQDSLRLVARLREALDAEFPLHSQRQSAAYDKLWQQLLKEASELLAE